MVMAKGVEVLLLLAVQLSRHSSRSFKTSGKNEIIGFLEVKRAQSHQI